MDEIRIFDNHKPALESGKYTVEISQSFKVGSNSLSATTRDLSFRVAGEKYALNQLQIDSVFPPRGAMGDFYQVLPHVILNRGTLPWEREAKNGASDSPWLALLLLTEDELSSSEDNSDNKAYSVKHVQVADAHSPQDRISILVYQNQSELAAKLPTFDELKFFTHVRVRADEEKAVVFCKRPPQRDKKNIVHLVSVENCYESGSLDSSIEDVDGNQYTALVSLSSWEFYCNDRFILTPEQIEEGIADEPLREVLRTLQGKEYFKDDDLITAIKDANNVNPPMDIDSHRELLLNTFRIGHLSSILKHLNRTPPGLRSPDPDPLPEQDTLSNVRRGYVNLPYILKAGKQIEALYRGPLLPGEQDTSDIDSVTLLHADQAFRYIKKANKLDVSYAAAWELGKLLAIQNRNFSIALYQWKRLCYQALKQGNQTLPPAPAYVSSWFENMMELKGIPFNYLVPAPAFIPFESIRFFSVDEVWLKHLIDGAFSIGRISKLEQSFDEQIYVATDFLKTPAGTRDGFLLHSVAVSGWPDLIIYNNTEGNGPFRTEKLSPNLLICLFNEAIGSLSIHQKPQSIHFGFESMNKRVLPVKISDWPNWKDSISITDFANSMVQRVEVVQFSLTSGP